MRRAEDVVAHRRDEPVVEPRRLVVLDVEVAAGAEPRGWVRLVGGLVRELEGEVAEGEPRVEGRVAGHAEGRVDGVDEQAEGASVELDHAGGAAEVLVVVRAAVVRPVRRAQHVVLEGAVVDVLDQRPAAAVGVAVAEGRERVGGEHPPLRLAEHRAAQHPHDVRDPVRLQHLRQDLLVQRARRLVGAARRARLAAVQHRDVRLGAEVASVRLDQLDLLVGGELLNVVRVHRVRRGRVHLDPLRQAVERLVLPRVGAAGHVGGEGGEAGPEAGAVPPAAKGGAAAEQRLGPRAVEVARGGDEGRLAQPEASGDELGQHRAAH
mmetsp:Transcript_21081/g.62387  ORF Transcript_21081/g.62387 Transcript_21081/m.62387 type:complete len:322 (+) Transcript_21081:226-1191(+)